MAEAERPPEHLFRFVAETTTDGLCFVDATGAISYVNDALAEVVGRSVEELLGTPVRRLFVTRPGDDATYDGGRTWENAEATLARGDDGLPALVSAVPLPEELGEPWRWLVRVTPYAGRRGLLEQLRARERALADAQEIARVGSWTWDPQVEVADWSAEMYRITGRDPESWRPTLPAFVALVHPEDREEVADVLADVLEGSDSFAFDARIVRPDGEVRWVRALGRAQVTASGARVISGTGQDIHTLKQADAEAAEATRRLRLLQEMAFAANRATTLAEAIEIAARALPADASGWEPLAAHVLDRDGPVPLSGPDGPGRTDLDLVERARRSAAIEVATVPGDPPTHSLVALPVSAGGRVVCVITLLADEVPPDEASYALLDQVVIQLGLVAEREQHAADLAEARDAAMEASRLKSEFLATMSHEIRTPMNGVIGLTDLLGRTPLDEQQQRLVDGLRDAGQTLMAIINDILDLSKIEAGKLELETADFDVRAVLHQTAGVCSGPAHDKGLELVVACAPEVPRVLRGDAVRLGQVVSNLASNAVKFTDRGEVVVEAELAAQSPHDAVLRVSVRDTGVGIDPAGRARLFDAFTQADPSTTRRHGGTGLGLAISQQLVHALGGEITVDSAPGRGSTFTFTARFARGIEDGRGGPVAAAGARATGSSPGTASLAGRRVLVVDDNATNRFVLTEQLRAWDVEALAVPTAAEALLALRTATHRGRAYDVAVLDLLMPDEDGLDLARRLRADPALVQPRLLLLTSDSAVGAGDARAAGVEATLAKPVRHDDLRDVLLSLLAPAEETGGRTARQVPDELGLRVLVVEDNPVNQLVATGILESRGYAVDVASDGLEAVERLRGRHGYAAVLMDCRMPRMDGFEATRTHRRSEPSGERVPIIAMTASALEGERERCLAAGMDDFLTKPVDPGDLDAVLHRWTGPQAAPPSDPAESAGRSRPTGPVLDPARVRMLDELRKDGVSFFVRTATSFTGRIDEQVAAIHEAVRAGDANRTFTSSHLVKGSALNLGLSRVAEVAQRMEDHAEAGTTAGMTGLLADLDREVAAAVSALRDAVER
ncbi:response regulator [Nocardioides deserti]|uniref:histidine kinase n=1 Tax=Nocardioides deserti TaxID=1588644 RepID=A0ABR6UCM1_9ACTN|nr:response regulator [Nocardioides deserti]MBC2961848.1 response regulator [Nocardioides deserti]